MEDKERIESTDEDVEGHGKKALQANEGERDETESDEDVEAHRSKHKIQ